MEQQLRLFIPFQLIVFDRFICVLFQFKFFDHFLIIKCTVLFNLIFLNEFDMPFCWLIVKALENIFIV